MFIIADKVVAAVIHVRICAGPLNRETVAGINGSILSERRKIT